MQFSLTSLLALAGAVAAAPAPFPIGIPSDSVAQTQLQGLKVAEWMSSEGYSREKFKHWISISGNCNTRETVLKRDGVNVVTDNACRSISGSWTSPYDGATWDSDDDIQIDHMVPLHNAWLSGAQTWTAAQREAFANDLTRPQLWAVTGVVNSRKSDSSPDEWKPPLTSFYCEYAKAWITVKSYWELTVTEAEKAALVDMMNHC
ncbi:hypothetical protein TD95_000275 [Thielaviopsis punctulata]|uniref:GmrSD restriction endonucleases C-terminal domain-containing protein n=1 Tax=Thielaviopsis punctulata TaxID=72032 RepID=A0A0F4ZED9_9PEZI|nr:hypothetical protein TD95_000275 [Thielaviopsis punctulata]